MAEQEELPLHDQTFLRIANKRVNLMDMPAHKVVKAYNAYMMHMEMIGDIYMPRAFYNAIQQHYAAGRIAYCQEHARFYVRGPFLMTLRDNRK